MSTPAEMAERHSRILSELAELGLSLARSLHERAVAAEDEEVAADLTLAFQRTSRSVRQTLALEAKLERDRLKEAQLRRDEDARRREDAARVKEPLIRERKAVLRDRLDALVWSEAEREAEDSEAEEALIGFIETELDAYLEEAALSDDFLKDSIESQVARICAELELRAPAVAPPQSQATEGADRRSSG